MMFHTFKSINNGQLNSNNSGHTNNRKRKVIKEDLKLSNKLKNNEIKITKKDYDYFKNNKIGDKNFLELVLMVCE